MLSLSHDELVVAAATIVDADAWCVLELCVDAPSQRWEPRLLLCQSDATTVARAIAAELSRRPRADARLRAYDRTTLLPMNDVAPHLCQVPGARAFIADVPDFSVREAPAENGSAALVRDAMSSIVVTVAPRHTVRDAARMMTSHSVGAAVVVGRAADGPGIITERDILRCNGTDRDIDDELVGDHLTSGLVYAEAEWPVSRAAEVMVRGGFRHVVVLDGPEVVGILSMRDIVRSWTAGGASTDPLCR